jgi:hypothetical protein
MSRAGGVGRPAMADRETAERVAAKIIDDVEREFSHASLELDFERPRREDEDAYLWVSSDSEDDEEIGDLWGYVIGLVEDAYDEHDVYLVARMKGRDVIREKRYDTE